MDIRVEVQPTTEHLHQLLIYADGQLIGEYERAVAGQVDRKIQEVERSKHFLVEIFQKHGYFTVRWDDRTQAKSVRIEGTEVARIPDKFWRD